MKEETPFGYTYMPRKRGHERGNVVLQEKKDD
jgi:hypothetical protein